MWNKETYTERLKEVEEILQSEEQYNLENLATYLLNSADVKEQKEKLDYSVPVNKTPKYLTLSKKQVINQFDKESNIISDYENLIRNSGNFRLNKEIRKDQLICKDLLNHTIYLKHLGEESMETDWFLFNFTTRLHVIALLKCRDINLANDIGCLVYDLKRLLRRITLTEQQQQILDLWSEDYRTTKQEIAEMVGIDRRNVHKQLNIIADKIVDAYKHSKIKWFKSMYNMHK